VHLALQFQVAGCYGELQVRNLADGGVDLGADITGNDAQVIALSHRCKSET
jgi:hypothetical protein